MSKAPNTVPCTQKALSEHRLVPGYYWNCPFVGNKRVTLSLGCCPCASDAGAPWGHGLGSGPQTLSGGMSVRRTMRKQPALMLIKILEFANDLLAN